MKRLVSIWVCKAFIWLGKKMGKKGSATPGAVALKIDPSILKKLAREVKKEIIVVCGTNGKTTTNNMLYSLLTEAGGHHVVCNRVGANMREGVTTAFIEATDFWGRMKADYATIELDDASAKIVFDHLTPHKIVMTNLFRDQLDRYGEIDVTIRLLEEAFAKAPDARYILNGDDPLTAQFGLKEGRRCVYYGIDEDLGIARQETKEGRFCAVCGEELYYQYFHYSQLGSYACEGCGFSRPHLQYRAIEVDFKDGLHFTLCEAQKQVEISVPYRGVYNIYNLLGAIVPALEIGITVEKMMAVLQGYQPQIGRMESFSLKKPVVLNLSKNPAGFNQAITTVLQDPRKKSVMIVINDGAQDGRDISWIWDVDFERLKVENIHHIVLGGIRKEDVAVRLKYADFHREQLSLYDDIGEGIKVLQNIEGEVFYVLVNYTALFETQKLLKKMEQEAAK